MTAIVPTTNWRYERKFVVTYLDRYEVESVIKLHPAIFSEIYPQRFVNNIYFDTVNASDYLDNITGALDRHKIRVRWYGNLFGLIAEPVLELKIKKGFLGTKIRVPLDPFHLGTSYRPAILQRQLARPDLTTELGRNLNSLRLALLNRYSRRYFESADHKFRLTIDSDMEFFGINPYHNSFMESILDHYTTILELKYRDKDDEEARFVTNHLPFRITKCSKYGLGFEKLELVKMGW